MGVEVVDEAGREGAGGSSVPGWLDEVRAMDGPGWSDPYLMENKPGHALSVYAVPFGEEGARRGFVALELSISTLNNRIGRLQIGGGMFTLLSRDGLILTHPRADFVLSESIFSLAERLGKPDAAEMARRMTGGESGVIRSEILSAPGIHWIVFAPIPTTGWSFSAAVPESLVMEFADSQRRIGIVMLAFLLALILGALLVAAARITRPLSRLAGAVERLGEGDLDVQVPGSTTADEIGDLTRGFNRMVKDLREHTEALTRETAARERVEGELTVAREIQKSLLPKSFPPFPDRVEFELHALNIPALQVAGDFFDFFLLPDGRLSIIMADVSGKGAPAALLMAVTRTIVRNISPGCGSPGEVLRKTNEIVCADSPDSMFVTMFLGWYDPSTGRLLFANGGHSPPYRLDAGGHVTKVGKTNAPAVGMFEGLTFPDQDDRLESGDRLVLYTDGVPEANDPAGNEYGEERFEAFLAAHSSETARVLCEKVAHEIESFEKTERHDDITILILGHR